MTLTSRLKKSLLTGLLASSLALGSIGCGGSSPAPTPQPPRPQPSLSQSVSLVNNVDINYNATLTNVALATRTITHDGNSFGNPTTISIPQYNETLSGLEKGDYASRLEATGATTHTLNWNIQNYAPTSNFSSLETNLNEGSQITLNFEGTFNDKNPEDNPVPLMGATPLSGGVGVVSINGYNVTIKAPEITDESIPEINYELNVDFGSSAGGLESAVLAGKVINVPDQIAFWSNRPALTETNCGACEDIYLGDLQGGALVNVKRLTTDPGQDLEPAWSPDGQQISFTTNRTGLISVHVMDSDGSNPTNLTPNIGHAQQPNWSPDGTKIALRYIDNNLGLGGIAVMNPDGTNFTRLVEESVSSRIPGGPSWSPDGTKIVFYTHRDGNWEIYKMNPDGSGLERLTNNLFVDQQPTWSPDGSKIAFISDRANPGGVGSELDIYLMNPDGSNVTQRTNELGPEVDPVWSPDGSEIVFAGGSTGNFHLYIMNKDGTGITQITSEGQNRYPAWRPWK